MHVSWKSLYSIIAITDHSPHNCPLKFCMNKTRSFELKVLNSTMLTIWLYILVSFILYNLQAPNISHQTSKVTLMYYGKKKKVVFPIVFRYANLWARSATHEQSENEAGRNPLIASTNLSYLLEQMLKGWNRYTNSVYEATKGAINFRELSSPSQPSGRESGLEGGPSLRQIDRFLYHY